MWWRIRIFFLRLGDYIIHIPQRIARFLRWLFWLQPLRGKHKFLRWLAGAFFLAIDMTPIPFLLESLLDWIKIKTRPLTETELAAAREIFGKAIPLQLIGIDPTSVPAKKRKTVAYVTFHTINFYRQIPLNIFIHELVHIWQYSKYGAAYITESIWAQKWGGGYNYGGAQALIDARESHGLSGFNFEQQADIVEEYFRWKCGMSLQWCIADDQVGELLCGYVEGIRGRDV